MEENDEHFMAEALDLARRGIERGDGGPFGAVIVSEGRIIGCGWNQVVNLNDPTAHAEMQAIRQACQSVANYHIPGSVLYATCEPCPMCLSAAYWAHIERLVYAAEAEDAAAIGFSDRTIKLELDKPLSERSIIVKQLYRKESLALFEQWEMSGKKKEY
ncbi:MAG: nucleoside deaminase [Candidatus Thiodiazotropha sp. (ex Lucinoma borealis)]|nr:nucleoside deaminase [Candidatus Thiodiazotropha sp. (ex Lucinoma borealis)]